MHLANEMLSLLSVLALAGDADAQPAKLPAVQLPALSPTGTVEDGRDAAIACGRNIEDVRSAARLRVTAAIDSMRLLLARLDAERAADQARLAAQLIQNQAQSRAGQ
jgi:hypothetical protein